MRYRTLSAPINVQLELTMRCNNRCLHCYNHCQHLANHGFEFKSIEKNVLDMAIDQIIRSKVFQVTITGGEPLIEWDLLEYALRRFKTADVACTLNSNLIFLDEKRAASLVSLGCKSVLTSLCSYDSEMHEEITRSPGSFGKTLKGIEAAKSAGMIVNVNMVVSSLNYEHVFKTGLLAKSLGAASFSATKAATPVTSKNFNSMRPTSEMVFASIESLEKLRSEHDLIVGVLMCYPLCFYKSQLKYPFLAERSCSAAVISCAIGSDGDVRACPHSDRIYGYIHDGGLVGAWKAMQEWRNESLLPSVCRKCDYIDSCGGGCRVDAEKCNQQRATLDPYAVLNNISSIVAGSLTAHSISPNDKFYVRRFKSRKERFGSACVFSNVGPPEFITSKTAKLLESLSSTSITAAELIRLTGLDEDDGIRLCQDLLVRDFLQPTT